VGEGGGGFSSEEPLTLPSSPNALTGDPGEIWSSWIPAQSLCGNDGIKEVPVRYILICSIALMLFAIALPAHASGVSNDLLLSSPWCTFKYNQTTGYSNTTRVKFNKNGTYSTGGRAEGYSSGRGGTYASQGDSQSAGKWKVVKGELYISEGYGQLNPVRTVVKKNSNGYPIILADGVEYSQCK
jgi:hypothetical protein